MGVTLSSAGCKRQRSSSADGAHQKIEWLDERDRQVEQCSSRTVQPPSGLEALSERMCVVCLREERLVIRGEAGLRKEPFKRLRGEVIAVTRHIERKPFS